MKKFLALACVVLFSSAAFAATEFTAAVTFSGGTVSFDASLSTGSQLTWNPNDITLNSSTVQWKAATAYIQMTKSITKNSGKVYFYQNNKAAAGAGGDSQYVATSSKTAGEGVYTYNGLVKGGTGGGETGYLPTSFKISTYTLTTPQIDPTATEKYGTRYITDKDDSNFLVSGEKKDYALVANAKGYVEDVDAGGKANNIEGSATVSTGYMYIGAGFSNVMGGDSFGSNHIKFEVVNE